jgi:hypothetical protein
LGQEHRVVMKGLSRQAAASIISCVIFLVAISVWGPGTTIAQNAANTAQCVQILSDVQKHLSEGCRALDKDQVCYGNRSITVEFQGTDSAAPTFAQAGDIISLSAIKSIKSSPLNPDRGEWGLAVLKAQVANLPNTTAGQTATFIIYGDTSFTNLTSPDPNGSTGTQGSNQKPAGPSCPATTTRATYLRSRPGPNEQTVELLQSNTPVSISERRADGQWVFAQTQTNTGWLYVQNLATSCDLNTLPVNDPNATAPLPGLNSFYFTTAVGAQSSCTDIPPAGLFIQSPGGRKVTFKANGADITIGSSIILSAQPKGGMVLSVIQGQATINVGGVQQTVIEGHQTTISLGGGPEGLDALGLAGPPRPISQAMARGLFLSTLCKAGNTAGLGIPCQIQRPTPTPVPPVRSPITTPITTVTATQNTCQPTQPGLPCNCNGFCDPGGESYYTCPQDCPFAPGPDNPSNPQCAPRGTKCSPRIGGCCAGLVCRNVGSPGTTDFRCA